VIDYYFSIFAKLPTTMVLLYSIWILVKFKGIIRYKIIGAMLDG